MILKKTRYHSFLITGLCLSLLAVSPTASFAAEERAVGKDTAQESVIAPESCTFLASAQALSDTEVSVLVTVSFTGEGAQVDLLSITLPGSSEQVLSSSDSSFSFTAGSDLEGCEIACIPGSSVSGEDTWFDDLAGSFTIPVIHTGSSEDTDSSTEDPDTAASEAASSDSSASPSAGADTSDSSASSAAEADSTDSSACSTTNASSESSSTVSGSSSNSKSKSTKKSRKASGSSSSGSSSSGSGSSIKSHSGSSSHLGSSGSSSHSRRTGSKSFDQTGSQAESEETTSGDAQLITEAASALGKRLLKNGETLTDDEENAPQLEGMTYEATWKNEESGICLYLYEEGYAVLEVSSLSSGKPAAARPSSTSDKSSAVESSESGSSRHSKTAETSSDQKTKTSLRFLLLPEQTEESSLDTILQSWNLSDSEQALS